MVFFAISRAWVDFTWFASAYDVDDVPYRLLTLVQMGSVLMLAASVHDAFGADGSFAGPTLGYVIMGVALVGQWLRHPRVGFLFSHLHFGVFATLATLGTGLEVTAASLAHHGEPSLAPWAVAVPVAGFLQLLGALRQPRDRTSRRTPSPPRPCWPSPCW